MIILRPDYIADPYGQDILLFCVSAELLANAVDLAKFMAFEYDKKRGLEPNDSDDYVILAGFEGRHSSVVWRDNY